MKAKTIYGLLLVICFSLSGLNAQDIEPTRSIIKYKDGSIFSGQILKENRHELVLLIDTGDTLHMEKKNIGTIYYNTNHLVVDIIRAYHPSRRWFYTFRMGGNRTFIDSGQFEVIVNKRWNENFSLGLGAGINNNAVWLPDRDWGLAHDFVVVFAYARYCKGRKRIRPFLSGKFGYGFLSSWHSNDRHSGGVHAQPGVGVQWAISDKFRLNITASQYLQYTSWQETVFDPIIDEVTIDYSNWLNRTIFSLSLEFN